MFVRFHSIASTAKSNNCCCRFAFACDFSTFHCFWLIFGGDDDDDDDGNGYYLLFYGICVWWVEWSEKFLLDVNQVRLYLYLIRFFVFVPSHHLHRAAYLCLPTKINSMRMREISWLNNYTQNGKHKFHLEMRAYQRAIRALPNQMNRFFFFFLFPKKPVPIVSVFFCFASRKIERNNVIRIKGNIVLYTAFSPVLILS